MVYTLDQTVPSYLCDRQDRLHPWAAVRLCQEVTEYHGNSVGGGFAKLVEQNRAWVIVRSYYEFHRRPAAFDKVMLNTWPRKNTGLFAVRDYELCDDQGALMVSGTAYWAVINFQTRRVERFRDDMMGRYTLESRQATDMDSLDK